jgi:hypothetical protein
MTVNVRICTALGEKFNKPSHSLLQRKKRGLHGTISNQIHAAELLLSGNNYDEYKLVHGSLACDLYLGTTTAIKTLINHMSYQKTACYTAKHNVKEMLGESLTRLYKNSAAEFQLHTPASDKCLFVPESQGPACL